jgi:hypothetical protein
MYELEKIGKVFTSKSVGTGPSSYEKGIYRAAVSQRLINTAVDGGGQRTRRRDEYLNLGRRDKREERRDL